MADVVVHMSGDEAKLWRSFQKIVAQQKTLEGGLKKTARAGDQVGKKLKTAGASSRQAFKTESVDKFSSAVGGLVGAGGVISLATKALNHMSQEAETAFTSLKGLSTETRRLNQVATSPGDYAAMQRRADRLAIKHAVEPNVVRDVMFSAKSEGFTDDLEYILKHRQVVDPKSLAGVAGQLKGLFPTATLTGREAMNMVLAGAQHSRLDFETLQQAMPRIAEGANLAGSSPAESTAIAAVLSSRFASGKTTADRGKAFGTKVGITPELAGKGIIGAFETIRDDWTEEARRTWLGESQELNTMYKVLGEELPRIIEQRGVIELAVSQTGTPGSPMARGLWRARQSPTDRALFVQEQAAIKRDVLRRQHLAVDEGQAQAARDNLVGGLYKSGAAPVAIATADTIAGIAKWLGFGPAVIELASVAGAGGVLTKPSASRSRPTTTGDVTDQTSLIRSLEVAGERDLLQGVTFDSSPELSGAEIAATRSAISVRMNQLGGSAGPDDGGSARIVDVLERIDGRLGEMNSRGARQHDRVYNRTLGNPAEDR